MTKTSGRVHSPSVPVDLAEKCFPGVQQPRHSQTVQLGLILDGASIAGGVSTPGEHKL
jgi:hypothetical protein